MANLSNLVSNLSELIHRIKCKSGHDGQVFCKSGQDFYN